MEHAYALETWLREKLGARQLAVSAAEAWTAAWSGLRDATKKLADPDLSAELDCLVDVAYRDRLEQPDEFAGQEPAAVVCSVRAVIDEYRQIVAKVDEACADDAAALEHARNAAASACVLRVQRCFVPPTTEEHDGT